MKNTMKAVRIHGRSQACYEEVPLPRPQAGLDIRADGLWASLYCETPFEHWSLGLEAFGLRLDAEDVDLDATSWESLIGERLAVGLDLEWELHGPPEPLADGGGYSQPGVCFGDVLVASDTFAIDVPSVRDHWWGGAPGLRMDASSSLSD